MDNHIDRLLRQVETARWRVAGLERHAEDALVSPTQLLPVALEELSVAFEELQAAQDELLHQQSELSSTREQVDAERRRYQELFHFAPDAYLVTTANGAIREANHAAAALLGVTESALVGTPLAVFVADHARRAFRRDMSLLRQVEGPQHWEVPMQPHEGALFIAGITVAAIRDWSGSPASLRWMLRDVTARKQAEEQLRALNEQLEERVRERTIQLEAALAEKDAALQQAQAERNVAEQAVRDREGFMAVVAHELKAPMAAIIGYSQLLQRRVQAGDTLKSRDLRGLRTIVDSARQLTTMADLLQDSTRIEAGTLHINRAPCNLCALAREVTETLRATLKHHALHVQCTEDPLSIEGDLLRLQQVLQNLLQNAIKYSQAGGEITVRVERVNSHARLSVRDHGAGIPESARERIFERFYRAGDAEQEQSSGMGIGLYVVKQIVALHGGWVEAESQVGAGSTFIVWLPLAKAS